MHLMNLAAQALVVSANVSSIGCRTAHTLRQTAASTEEKEEEDFSAVETTIHAEVLAEVVDLEIVARRSINKRNNSD